MILTEQVTINTKKVDSCFTEFSLLKVSYHFEDNKVYLIHLLERDMKKRTIKTILKKCQRQVGVTSQRCLPLSSKTGARVTTLRGQVRR